MSYHYPQNPWDSNMARPEATLANRGTTETEQRPAGENTWAPTSAYSAAQLQEQQQHQQHQHDVAGVLRRNQACLACRRRKLKCDAIRPHCSTCVRSHKHLMRTAPKTNPILSCDYDDGNGPGPVERTSVPASPGSPIVVDDGETARKKRKSTGGENKRKKESEAERLKRRIEELEARLAGDNGHSVNDQIHSANQSRHSSASNFTPPILPSHHSRQSDEIAAESPTSFLDMLSAAATTHAPPSVSRNTSAGLRAGVTGAAMMNGATGTFVPPPPAESPNYHTGFTPAFSYDDSQQNSGEMRPPPIQHHSSTSSTSTHSMPPPVHTGSMSSSFSVPLSSGSSEPIALTPGGIFNFSPGPPEPVDYESMPMPDKHGRIQPSTRLMGPWQAVNTVDTFVAAATAQARASVQFTSIPDDFEKPPHPMADPGRIPQAPLFNVQQDVPMQDFSVPFEEDLQQQMLMDLFWPGWPPGLPEPHIVNELIDVFFDSVPSLPRMMLRSRFMTRMTLPPTHSNFPHPALLHAICAIGANWCAPAVHEKSTVARTLNGVGGKHVDFGTWQSGLAKDAVQEGLNTGNRMFDVVRSMMILSRLFIDDTRMLECWAYHGLVARMILPLGLNVRSAELSLKSVMLPPPADAVEREERRAAMWFAFYHDTVSSAASGWGNSIALDEFTVPLPCAYKEFETGSKDMPANPQDAESSDLFTHHPVIDPFVLCLKASIVTSRATKLARKWKNRHLRDNDDLLGMNKPEFRELANDIACLQMSIPYELRNPCKMDHKRNLDIDLIVAHMMPHAALIFLYEPFADVTDSSDGQARRILAAAQAIVGIVQQLAIAMNEGSNNFSMVMHSAASVCLVTAARTCLVFFRHALNVGDDRMAASLRSDVEVIRMALEQFGLRFKIGHHHAQLISYFLDRATYPTYEKLISHYPDHPRPGAPILHPQADFGICVLNALNVKRGYWRIKRDQRSTGSMSASASASGSGMRSADPSPFAMTPESAGGMNGGTGIGGARIETESPQPLPGSGPSRSGSGSHTTTLADVSISKADPAALAAARAEEEALGHWLPHLGSKSSYSSAQGDHRSGSGSVQGNGVSEDDISKQQSQPISDTPIHSHPMFTIQLDGTRHLFGTLDKDRPANIGPRMDVPDLGSSSGPGPSCASMFGDMNDRSSEGETRGVRAGKTAPLVAESAAWFMAPERGGFRGPRS